MLALGKKSGSKVAIPDRTFKCSRGFHLYPGAMTVEAEQPTSSSNASPIKFDLDTI